MPIPSAAPGSPERPNSTEVHPYLCRHAWGVPEHDGDDAHSEVAEREELRRVPPLRGLSDDGGTEYSPDRHAAANDPDLDSAAVELSDDEHDEQDQEEALRDLADGVDEEQRSQPALGEDRAYSGTYAAGDDVTGVFVGGDRSGVGSHERGRDRDGEERGRVDDDDGADTAEADGEASERGADEPSQTRTGRVGSVGNRQLIRRHDSREQGDGRRVVDLCVRIA